jgi:hypothetical protein
MQATSSDEGNKHRTVVLEVHDKKTIPDEPACCSCPKCFKVSPITATALMGLSSILAFGSGFFQSSYMSFGSGVISVFALVLQRRESLMLLSAATGGQHPGAA